MERLEIEEAERLLWRALREADQEGAPALDRAEILDELGTVAISLGRKEEAEKLFLRALDMKRNYDDSPATAITLRLLSDLLFSEGLYARSEELMLKALQIQKSTLPPGDPERVQTLLLLGALYQGTRDYTRAEKAYLQGIQEAETAGGERHPHFGTGLGMLLDLYKETGQQEKRQQAQKRYDALLVQETPPSPGINE